MKSSRGNAGRGYNQNQARQADQDKINSALLQQQLQQQQRDQELQQLQAQQQLLLEQARQAQQIEQEQQEQRQRMAQQQPPVLPPQGGQLAVQRSPYALLQADIANADNTLNLQQDVALARAPQINQNWKTALITAISTGAVKGISGDDATRVMNNTAASSARQYSQCDNAEILQYMAKHAASIPDSMKNVMNRLFQGDGNADLKTAVAKAFVKYTNKNNNPVISISIGKMYKASDRASGYDKVVLLKARRIVKLIKQSIAAANMKNDLSLTKDYQVIRGYYNANKLTQLPSARVAYARALAKRLGALDNASYQTALAAGKQRSAQHIEQIFNRFAQTNPETVINLNQDQDSSAAARLFYKNYMSKGAKQSKLSQQALQYFNQGQLADRQRRDAQIAQNFPQPPQGGEMD